MYTKWLLPVLAVGSFAFALHHVVVAQTQKPAPPPPVDPARSPFQKTVAANGLVEAKTENISIGSHVPGVVDKVFVKVGQKVKAGDPLFRLDDRQRNAELEARRAALEAARARLAKLEKMPRAEELPPAEAKMREASAALVSEADLLRRARALMQRSAIAEEEMVRREQSHRVATEQLAKARADLELLKAGAWQPDVLVARAEVAQAAANLAETQTELERLQVCASVDGEVLQVNVRPGEYAGTPPGQPLIVLGDVHRLHVRVDIDEHDIFRFDAAADGYALVRGNTQQKYPIRFVRVEPFVVPKKSLTGDTSERVDTRVLQVIYAVETSESAPRLYVGQQMDIFIEAEPRR
jgi:multidrug efflux pump subunit AcrA (membrane-fusion protein)